MRSFVFLFFVFFTLSFTTTKKEILQTDRFLELDIYWFDKNKIDSSAQTFIEHYAPLYENVGGKKGVIINIGWLPDYIYEWNGDLLQEVTFQKEMKHWPWFDIKGTLKGTTEQRQEQWKSRFPDGDKKILVKHQSWSYADLKHLVESLKREAKIQLGHSKFRTGCLVLGWQNIYDSEGSYFDKRHPEAYKKGIWHMPVVNHPALLNADTHRYGAFPDGIPQNLPLTEFFGKQWGSMSKAVGFDAIVLRDSYIGSAVYARKSINTSNINAASTDTAFNESWHKATANLVRQTKLSNPDALVIGYSNGASAIGELRLNCVDLERIANEGYLDIYIEQTWAGAFSEPGMTASGFWNKPNEGYTFQLSNQLVRAAMLAPTKTKLYTLIETFDAWESWDVIHTVPERLLWEIWAYHHAGVKTPNGLKMPAGTYISWCNRGHQMLSDEDVQFLASNINEAVMSSNNTKDIFGPTLVYNRQALTFMQKNYPDKSIKEWLDDEIAGVMKWSVPVLSITRIEYIDSIKSDLLVLQTPVQLSPSARFSLLEQIKKNAPLTIFASPAGGIDSLINQQLGISTTSAFVGEVIKKGKLVTKDSLLAKDIPSEFDIIHRISKFNIKGSFKTIYSVNNIPALFAINKTLVWDPSDMDININNRFQMGLTPMDKEWGSIYSHLLTARCINQQLIGSHSPTALEQKAIEPVSMHAWQLANGSVCLLVADLEEGINHFQTNTREVFFNIPTGWDYKFVNEKFYHTKSTRSSRLDIKLKMAESRLYVFSR